MGGGPDVLFASANGKGSENISSCTPTFQLFFSISTLPYRFVLTEKWSTCRDHWICRISWLCACSSAVCLWRPSTLLTYFWLYQENIAATHDYPVKPQFLLSYDTDLEHWIVHVGHGWNFNACFLWLQPPDGRRRHSWAGLPGGLEGHCQDGPQVQIYCHAIWFSPWTQLMVCLPSAHVFSKSVMLTSFQSLETHWGFCD